ncbi:MAG TPA: hypothetical protein VMH79_04415 [Thermoanaerobaculia bacterium]|nr:hypothetical protein [Thermoanaerobaculia bacterium]
MTTAGRFPVSAALAWERLLLYEQIERKPPLLLRALLPSPLGTEGPKASVGDRTLCRYREGLLIKRVTAVSPPHHWRFDVVAQDFAIAGGIRLVGGRYAFRDLADGGCEVELETRYAAARRPRWLWRRVEAAVCHAFHRHLLAAMAAVPWPVTPTPPVFARREPAAGSSGRS